MRTGSSEFHQAATLKQESTKEDKTMTKNIEKRAKELRVPAQSTSEELECRGFKVLTFGNKILAVGYYYMGRISRATTEQPTPSQPTTTPAKEALA
jgi:hypothetical protein